jgi:hypothetical protein
MSGNVHCLTVEVDLTPMEGADFVTALTGQDQELEQVSKWPSDLFGRLPDKAEFVISQHAISAPLSGWRPQSITWRSVE